MQETRPSVFIGSSSEGHRVAEALQANLHHDCDAAIWSQGLFGLSGGTLESLVELVEDFDFAILVITPDDLVRSRGQERQAPRDNVLLEIGLFIGALGRRRTFVVFDEGARIKLPSDLAGVSLAGFQLQHSGNLQASLGPACFTIKMAMEDLGALAKPRRIRELQGVYSIRNIEGESDKGQVEVCYVGRRMFRFAWTRPTAPVSNGYFTMSEQLPGYGTGFFRYDLEEGCGLLQIWLNPVDGSIDVHVVNMIGGTNPQPFTYSLHKINSEEPN